MPKARNLPPDQEGIFHIYNRGNNGNEIFHSEDDFLAFLNIIEECKEKFDFLIHHYCILINHYHFIIRATGEALSNAMKRINYCYSINYGKKYGHKGRLWQGRFRSEIIDTEEYLAVCNGYVELNAIKHQIVASPKQYAWSSYHHYAFGKTDSIVATDSAYLDLANNDKERQRIYREISKERAATLKMLYHADCPQTGSTGQSAI